MLFIIIYAVYYMVYIICFIQKGHKVRHESDIGYMMYLTSLGINSLYSRMWNKKYAPKICGLTEEEFRDFSAGMGKIAWFIATKISLKVQDCTDADGLGYFRNVTSSEEFQYFIAKKWIIILIREQGHTFFAKLLKLVSQSDQHIIYCITYTV